MDAIDVDQDANTLTVVGEGRHVRVVRIGVKAVRAVDLRSRARHQYAGPSRLAQKGRLTDSGIELTRSVWRRSIRTPSATLSWACGSTAAGPR